MQVLLIRRFLEIVLLLALSSQAAAQSASTDVTAIAHHADSAVVLITVSNDAGTAIKFGSGFVISADGKVITNHHVIEQGSSATIKFADGAFYQVAGVVADDPSVDLAILQIKSSVKSFSYLRLGDSEKVDVGQPVVAIGSPLALEGTVSNGIISSVRRTSDLPLRQLRAMKVFQTTAPISPGSSGGVLLNTSGEVIGVPTFASASGQNINFAIPSHEVETLLTESAGRTPAPFPSKGSPASAIAAPSAYESLSDAKTLCVWVRNGSPVLKTEISGKLAEWGKLKLVSSPENADLVLEVVQVGQLNVGTGAGNQATALLRDRASGTELWSKTKGGSWAMSGWNNGWVAHALAKEFIKFYESTTKHKAK